MCSIKALDHLLSINDGDAYHSSALNLAAEVIGSAHDPRLTESHGSYLLGDSDGIPKVTLQSKSG